MLYPLDGGRFNFEHRLPVAIIISAPLLTDMDTCSKWQAKP